MSARRITDEQAAELARLCAEVTPGPWTADDANTIFRAAARNALLDLLADRTADGKLIATLTRALTTLRDRLAGDVEVCMALDLEEDLDATDAALAAAGLPDRESRDAARRGP